MHLRRLFGRLCIRPRSRATSPRPAVTPVPPTTDALSVTTGAGNPAFDAAVEEFTKKLTDEERNAFNRAHTGINVEQLYQRVAKLDAMDKQTKPRQNLDAVQRFLHLLNQLVKGVSIGIQASPEISSLVVGGAKLIIDMAMNFVDFFQQLSVMIQHLSGHLGHLEELSRHKDNHLIFEGVKNVYNGLLDFYHHAYRVFKDEKGQRWSHPHLRSGIQAQWKPFAEVFGGINSKIERHLGILERSTNAATYSTVVNLDKRGKKELEDRERKEILQWLSTKDFDSHQDAMLHKRYSGTGGWLLEHASFEHWLAGPDGPRLLWCSGGPGTGKSVLSSVVVDHIKRRLVKRSQSSQLAYAYFNYQHREESQTGAIVASLAKHLIRSQEIIPDIVVQTFRDHNGQDKKPDLQTTTDFFCAVAHHLSEIFVVVDALDECNDEDKGLFLGSFIGRVLHNFPHARVLITSRPEASISDFLHSLSALEIKIGGEKTREDISKYIRGQMVISTTPTPAVGGGLRRTLRVQDPKVRDEIIESLKAKSDGMFLWVNLQINQILQQKNDSDIREVLKELPKGLDNTYIRILQRVEHDYESGPLLKLFRKCLMWATHARKQLRLYELRDAVVTDENFTDMSGLEKQREKYTMADIMDTCRGLLVSEDSDDRNHQGGWAFVRPVHSSLVEFLRKDPSVALPNFTILRDPMAVEFELANICLHHLRHVCLAKGPASSFSELLFRLAGKNQPFAWYCAKFFDYHAAEAKTRRLKLGLESLLIMDESCLAALAQLRHMRRPNLEVDFKCFDWDVNSRTIVETSRLSQIPYIRDDSRWKALTLHPSSLHQACAEANSDQVKYLLGMVSDPDVPNSSGETPFHIAVFRQNLDVVRILLEAGADVNQICRYQETALEMASRIGDAPLLALLLDNGAKGLEKDCTFRQAFENAVQPKRENIARLLLSHGAIPTRGLFLNAAKYGMQKVVEAGLLLGYDPNGEAYAETPPGEPSPGPPHSKPQGNRKYRTKDTSPLYCASRWGWTDVVKVLLDHGADANLIGGSVGTALQAAALGGRLDIVQLLLSHGAKDLINQADGSHGTALSAAASRGQDLVVRELLAAGACVNTPGGQFGCPLVASVEFDESMISSRPPQFGGRLSVNSTIDRKIDVGEHNVTEPLIEAGANIIDQGPAALSKAAKKGHKKLVDLLLAHGAQFDVAGLSKAIWTNNADIAKIVIGHGADPNKLDHEGCSPLLKAVNSGNVGLVQVLIEGGACPNLSARTPKTRHGLDLGYSTITRGLHAACTDGNLSIVKFLLHNGADPNLPGTMTAGQQHPLGAYVSGPAPGSALLAACTGRTGKHPASMNQSTDRAEIVSLLLERGAGIDQVDQDGWTALERVCSLKHPDPDAYEIASILINAGANISASSSTHSGPLEAAARHGHLKIVQLLLNKGVNDDVQRQSALQVAAEYGRDEIVRLLISAGVDVGTPRGSSSFVRENDKPIHIAARRGNYSLVRILIDAGARLDDKGHDGEVYETTLVGLRLHRKHGGFAELMRLLRNEKQKEPPATCHYGFLCNGPQCSGSGEAVYSRWLQRWDAKPDAWICGTRHECCECEDFNLCSACNDIFGQEETSADQNRPTSNHSSNTSSGGSQVSGSQMQHNARHKTKRFDIREEPDTEVGPCEIEEHNAYYKADVLVGERLEMGMLWKG